MQVLTLRNGEVKTFGQPTKPMWGASSSWIKVSVNGKLQEVQPIDGTGETCSPEAAVYYRDECGNLV